MIKNKRENKHRSQPHTNPPHIFPLIFFYAVIISHRLAGPIFRLEKDLDKIIEGDHSIRIRFRSKDCLDSLANKLNQVLNRLPK